MKKVIKEGKTQLNTRIPYELYRQLQDYAGKQNVHMEEMITELLEHAIANPPPPPKKGANEQ